MKRQHWNCLNNHSTKILLASMVFMWSGLANAGISYWQKTGDPVHNCEITGVLHSIDLNASLRSSIGDLDAALFSVDYTYDRAQFYPETHSQYAACTYRITFDTSWGMPVGSYTWCEISGRWQLFIGTLNLSLCEK